MADTKTSDETAASALTGAELVRIVQSAANRRTTTQEIADLASGGGLYGGAMSAVPTSAGTGLSTWLNQDSATVADRSTGITLARANPGNVDAVRGRTKTPAQSTPYTVSALIALTASTLSASQNNTQAGIGWYDGTNKLHLINVAYSSGWLPVVAKWNTPTSILSNDYLGVANMIPEPMIWFHLVDDGTNAKFGYSRSGAAEDAHILFSVAKASGHLGGSGYTNLIFYLSPNDCDGRATLMSWSEAAGAAF